MELLVIGSDNVLVHVPRIRLGRKGRIVKQRARRVRERKRQQLRTCRYAVLESADLVVGEERWVESYILVNVVVDAVIHETESSSHHELLSSEHVPRKTYSGREVVRVFIPNLVIPGCNSSTRDSRIEWIRCRDERVDAGRRVPNGWKWSDRRAEVEV